jgi:RimJ/RimL family protein N-acetyltransferase
MTTAPELLSAATRRRTVAAWAKAMGASQQDLSSSGWIFVEREDFDSVVVVHIDQIGLAAAPLRVLDVVRAVPRTALLDAEALARFLPRGADPIGSADLLFAERIPPASAITAVTARPEDVASVRSGVSSTEWDESGVEEMARVWAARTSPLGAAAIAGYRPWSSALAQMGVIATQQHRGAGFAYAAAAAATEAALAEGLIAQWRSRQGNDSSKRLAERLGFAHLGIQAAVRLPPP